MRLFTSNSKPGWRDLVWRLVALLLLVVLSEVALAFGLPAWTAGYLFALDQKMQRLQETRPPRIILCGGSSLAFGMDSERVERALGRPVINMGLSAGLGLQFMLNQVDPYLRSGDTLVVAAEYLLYTSPSCWGGEGLTELIFLSPSQSRYLGRRHIWTLIRTWPEAVQRRLTGALQYGLQVKLLGMKPNEWYSCRGFNAYGDMVFHLDLPPRLRLKDLGRTITKVPTGHGRSDYLPHLAHYVSRMQQRGVEMFFIPVPYAQEAFQPEGSDAAVYRNLKRCFPNRVLSDPVDFTFPLEQCFYDSILHCNREGRRRRTDMTIDLLRGAGINPPNPGP